jgi:hypothetical protein
MLFLVVSVVGLLWDHIENGACTSIYDSELE